MNKLFIQLLLDLNIIKNETDIPTNVTNFYINSAREFIKYYVNKQDYDDSDYDENFENQILNIALYMYQTRKDRTLASKTQGSRSISFRNFVIPEEYYTNLPRYPRIYSDVNMGGKKNCCTTRDDYNNCFFGKE